MHLIRIPLVLLTLALTFTLSPAIAQEEAPSPREAALRRLMERNYAALRDMNMPNYLRTLHPDSPIYGGSLAMTKKQFEQGGVQPRIESFELVGTSGDYAFVRMVTVVEQPEDKPPLKYNHIDTLYCMRRYKGGWLIWQQLLLDRGNSTE